MPNISIKRRHKLDPKHARAAAQRIAKDLNKRFGLICQWDGDEVRFDGVGVSGNITPEWQVTGGVRYWVETPDGGPTGWGARLFVTYLFPKG